MINMNYFQNSDSSSPRDPFTQLRHLTDCALILRVKNVETLITKWMVCPPGSLAYTEDEEAMLVRVGSGWQYVLVSEENEKSGNTHYSGSKKFSFNWFQLGTLVTSQEADSVVGGPDLSEDAD